MRRDRDSQAWLDIISFTRRGPADRIQLTPGQIQTLARTVSRTPEVMVKVTGGAQSVSKALAHVRYVDRQGDLEIETDEGESLKGRGVEQQLLEDWDLDVSTSAGRTPYTARPGRKPTKLTHHVILSMPAGTDPQGLLVASRGFAREQFALTNRYALVLHTDQAHPHVHLVIKAEGEDGKRLHIRKATLRDWRQQFARQLRTQGIAANATDRITRGQTRKCLHDGIYRANRRGVSRHVTKGQVAPGTRERLWNTRDELMNGWRATAGHLRSVGHTALAADIERFVQTLPRVQTDQEHWRQAERTRRPETVLERTH